MQKKWYIAQHPQLWTAEQVRSFVQAGKITRTTLLRREDASTAMPAGKIKGLFPEEDEERVDIFNEPVTIPSPTPEEAEETVPPLRNAQDPWLSLERAGPMGYLHLALHPQLYSSLIGALAVGVALLIAGAVIVGLAMWLLMPTLLSLNPALVSVFTAALMLVWAAAIVLRVPFALGESVIHRNHSLSMENWPILRTGLQGGILLALVIVIPTSLAAALHPLLAVLILAAGIACLPLFMVTLAEANGQWSGLNPSLAWGMLRQRYAAYIGLLGSSILAIILCGLGAIGLLAFIGFLLPGGEAEGILGLVVFTLATGIVLSSAIIAYSYMAAASGLWWRQGLAWRFSLLDAEAAGKPAPPANPGNPAFAGFGGTVAGVSLLLALVLVWWMPSDASSERAHSGLAGTLLPIHNDASDQDLVAHGRIQIGDGEELDFSELMGALQVIAAEELNQQLQAAQIDHQQQMRQALANGGDGSPNRDAQAATNENGITRTHTARLQMFDSFMFNLNSSTAGTAKVEISSNGGEDLTVAFFDQRQANRIRRDLRRGPINFERYDALEVHENVKDATLEQAISNTNGLLLFIVRNGPESCPDGGCVCDLRSRSGNTSVNIRYTVPSCGATFICR